MIPVVFLISLNNKTNSKTVSASKAEVGSSSNKKLGFKANERAIATLCR